MTALKISPIFALAALIPSGVIAAETQQSAGIWWTYQYLPDDKTNTNSGGEFTGEALILYFDGDAEEDGNWFFSSELRVGPGSFTDPDNNSTGGEYTLHKAWIGWRFDEDTVLRVGKSQVPFGWKTSNFWPGDILLAGFGDQMDVGFKLSREQGTLNYDVAYYHADDWGSTSTDTVDDNRHWGSSTTFRKVQTAVGNLQWEFMEDQTLGLSLQSGKLQDLSGTPNRPLSGSHEAAVLYYEGEFDNIFAKASWIQQQRHLPDGYVNTAPVADTIENQRYALELGYKRGPWTYYLDASAAKPDTKGSNASTVTAFAPGLKYNYGPGWIYVEYLTQDGYVDRNGQVGEGDFDALYISFDFYL